MTTSNSKTTVLLAIKTKQVATLFAVDLSFCLQIQEARHKHTVLTEQLNEQLDQNKRARASLEKTKNTLEQENHEMANEIKQLSAGKQVTC